MQQKKTKMQIWAHSVPVMLKCFALLLYSTVTWPRIGYESKLGPCMKVAQI